MDSRTGSITFTVVPDVPEDTSVGLIEFSRMAKRDAVRTLTDGRSVLTFKIKPKMTTREGRIAVRRAVAAAKKAGLRRIAFNVADDILLSTKEFATECMLANYDFAECYKKAPEEGWDSLQEVFLIYGKLSNPLPTCYGQLLDKGVIVGEGVNFARDLANAPACLMTPERFVDRVRAEMYNHTFAAPVSVHAYSLRELEELGMGGILAVGKGSQNPPLLLVMQYMNGPKDAKPIVLVGKGVCFDTGGANLKSSEHIEDMHLDKSGAAAVVAAIVTAARLGVKRNIIVIAPLVENRLSASSYLTNDIITMSDGTTVEFKNTDAEGRLILADALVYARQFEPRLVIDVATLTGASYVALGDQAMALFTRHDREGDGLARELTKMGEESGDYLWRMPLWDEYDAQVEGDFADLRNTGSVPGAGGAITAAAFLKHFAKEYRWAHIDMVPKMTEAKNDSLAKGATGAPVRLLVKLLETY